MQEVFEKIIEKLEEYEYENLVEHDSEMANHCKQDCNDVSDCTLCVWDKAIEIVKQEAEKFVPDTNVGNNGWIPCSVRIPTEQERWFGHDLTDVEPREFIVMVKGAYEPTTGYYHSKYGWIKDLTGEYDDKNTGYGNEIVAWRFFPQPYQPKGE